MRKKIDSCSHCGQILSPIASCKKFPVTVLLLTTTPLHMVSVRLNPAKHTDL